MGPWKIYLDQVGVRKPGEGCKISTWYISLMIIILIKRRKRVKKAKKKIYLRDCLLENNLYLESVNLLYYPLFSVIANHRYFFRLPWKTIAIGQWYRIFKFIVIFLYIHKYKIILYTIEWQKPLMNANFHIKNIMRIA